jgi:hypothetical protein
VEGFGIGGLECACPTEGGVGCDEPRADEENEGGAKYELGLVEMWESVPPEKLTFHHRAIGSRLGNLA